MGGNVGSQGSGEAFPKEHVAIPASLSLLDPDLAGFEVQSPYRDPAELKHPRAGVQEHPEHQAACIPPNRIPRSSAGVQRGRKPDATTNLIRLVGQGDQLQIAYRSPNDKWGCCRWNFSASHG